MSICFFVIPLTQGSFSCTRSKGGEKIAANVKKSRDASFRSTNDQGQVANRTEGIASVGSAALDNEECYLYQKFLRGLGLVYIEHQARI